MEQIKLDITTEEVTKEEEVTTKSYKEIQKEEKENAKKKALEEKAKKKEEEEKKKALVNELKEKLFNDITTKNKDLKENVTIVPATKYDGVRYKGKVIAEVKVTVKGLIVRVLDIYGEELEGLKDDYVTREGENDLQIRKCPNRFGWRTNTELLLENKKQYKQVFDGLKASAELQKKQLEEKTKKKEEEKKEKK